MNKITVLHSIRSGFSSSAHLFAGIHAFSYSPATTLFALGQAWSLHLRWLEALIATLRLGKLLPDAGRSDASLRLTLAGIPVWPVQAQIADSSVSLREVLPAQARLLGPRTTPGAK